jgi:alkylation response protein AidB-like acyl-CoA dehydrogenase
MVEDPWSQPAARRRLSFVTDPLLATGLGLIPGFAATAVERDRRGGCPKAERDALRRSGLLGASVDGDLGGAGAAFSAILDLVRLFSEVDSSLGHVFGFHHLMLATLRLFGGAEQWRPLHARTVEHRWFWGNALNPLDPGTRLQRGDKGYELNGVKSFSSGSVDADWLIVSALDADERLVVAALPGTRPGVTARADWDNMGQRQTDSGTVEFRQVALEEHELLRNPGPLSTPRSALRPLLAQLILANVYLGLGQGALANAVALVRGAKRAWPGSGVESKPQDPYVRQRIGDAFAELEGVRVLADHAARLLDGALDVGPALAAQQRGDVAVAVASVKVQASRAALRVTSEIFELVGASATKSSLALDRFWRNARTHTLHDPLDYKLRELGDVVLSGQPPKPSFYS